MGVAASIPPYAQQGVAEGRYAAQAPLRAPELRR